jgi:hypothetical protein
VFNDNAPKEFSKSPSEEKTVKAEEKTERIESEDAEAYPYNG